MSHRRRRSNRADLKPVRKLLDGLYLGAALLGAAFVAAIGLLITAQVVGREFGVQVKGADDLTAWSVVAAGFLPLAYTYRTAGHIRVTLLVELVSGWPRRVLEIVILSVALFFIGYLCYSGFDMLWDSYRFGDLSQGLIVVPIWIPQLSIPLGTLVLAIAVVDDLVTALLGGPISYLRESSEGRESVSTRAD